MKNFEKILDFQKLLKEFNQIKRDLGSIHNKENSDNDVEHSYRVAMLCWMVIDEYKLNLDLNRVIKYALVHDFVEVYAGDVSLYSKTGHENKEKKEHESLLKLKSNYPNLISFFESIETYEKRADEESKFVYLIEKLEPILVVLVSEEDHWIKRNLSFNVFKELKQKKIKNIDNFAQIFNKEIMEYLEQNKEKFFIE